jgi:Ca2+-binding EF-hand superfamily protein
MKNMAKKSTIFLGLAVLLSLGLNAQELPQRGPIPFSVYDTNNDNFVSEKEFYDARTKRMEQKAAQGMPMRNASNAPIFTDFDTNGDGKLSEIELLKGQNAQMMNKKANKGNKGFQNGMNQ